MPKRRTKTYIYVIICFLTFPLGYFVFLLSLSDQPAYSILGLTVLLIASFIIAKKGLSRDKKWLLIMGAFLLLNIIPIPRVSHQLDCAEICQQAEPTSFGIGFPSSLIKYYTADVSQVLSIQEQEDRRLHPNNYPPLIHSGDIRTYPFSILFNLTYFLVLAPYIAIILNAREKLNNKNELISTNDPAIMTNAR